MLQEDPKIGTQLSENEKRVLVDRYLEVSLIWAGLMTFHGTVFDISWLSFGAGLKTFLGNISNEFSIFSLSS